MTPPPRILLAAHTYAHHSQCSGYEQVIHHLKAAVVRSGDHAWSRWPEGSAGWRIGRRLFDALILARAQTADLVHFLYAENHLRLLFKGLRVGAPRRKLVGTVHLPLDYYSAEKSLAALRCLDGVIALTSDHAQELRRHLPEGRIWFIPHGCTYDHPYRDPDRFSREASFQIAVVGANYRDWDTLQTVLDEAATRHPDWMFHGVGWPSAKILQWTGRRNLQVHPRLEEPEYYALLNRCHLLLLPLRFATANNCLLEAYSVGLPALCSDVAGVRDYGVSTTRFFQHADQALAGLEQFADIAPGRRAETRETTWREGRRFAWENVCREIMAAYQEVLGG